MTTTKQPDKAREAFKAKVQWLRDNEQDLPCDTPDDEVFAWGYQAATQANQEALREVLGERINLHIKKVERLRVYGPNSNAINRAAGALAEAKRIQATIQQQIGDE